GLVLTHFRQVEPLAGEERAIVALQQAVEPPHDRPLEALEHRLGVRLARGPSNGWREGAALFRNGGGHAGGTCDPATAQRCGSSRSGRSGFGTMSTIRLTTSSGLTRSASAS